MKKLIYLAVLGLLFSCEKKDDSPKNEIAELTSLTGQSELSYSESSDKWNNLKNKNGNSYFYQTTFISWAGFGSVTELKVVDGIVTSRIYQEFQINDNNGEREIVDSYSETINNLGIHSKGASLLTIDELYYTCASEYLIIDEKDNTLYFDTDLNGIMTLCGFVPNGCMDDCYIGVSISSFDWIK